MLTASPLRATRPSFLLLLQRNQQEEEGLAVVSEGYSGHPNVISRSMGAPSIYIGSGRVALALSTFNLAALKLFSDGVKFFLSRKKG